MVVGVLQLEILLHSPLNLKQKRGLVQKLLGRCRSRFPVSCAETGAHDLWQRARLGFSVVHREEAVAHAVFEKIIDDIEQSGYAEVIDRFVEFLHY
ncbi:MAG: DUF503 domain-containing protein [Desulfuromonadaceae bacterium]|jgi:uncharacterized protein